eukprot:gene2545-2940_t
MSFKSTSLTGNGGTACVGRRKRNKRKRLFRIITGQGLNISANLKTKWELDEEQDHAASTEISPRASCGNEIGEDGAGPKSRTMNTPTTTGEKEHAKDMSAENLAHSDFKKLECGKKLTRSFRTKIVSVSQLDREWREHVLKDIAVKKNTTLEEYWKAVKNLN